MTRRTKALIEKELEIALENRAFEIQLFWQRSNYFLVLMTALGIGVFTIDSSTYSFFLSVFAAITSWYWYQTNLGSKFWQESWEVEVVKLSKEFKIRSFERPTDEIIKQVNSSFNEARLIPDDAGIWTISGIKIRRFIDKQIIRKPSVSHYMILLSATSIFMWSVVAAMHGYDLFSGMIDSAPDPRTASVASPNPDESPAHDSKQFLAEPKADGETNSVPESSEESPSISSTQKAQQDPTSHD